MTADDTDWTHYPALAASRALSQRLLTGLRDDVERLGGPGAPLFVAAAGSLARLEAHAASDCDLLLAADGGIAAAIRSHIDGAIAAQGLRAPRADGIYSGTLQRDVLLAANRRGSLSEAPADFGRRMALLLDAAPISNDSVFRRWQRDVLDWYTDAPDGATWQLLVDDLGRYRHAYRSWQRFERQQPHWALRQLKLQGSRAMGYAGLLLLIMQAAAHGDDGQRWLAGRLVRTPLERVLDAMASVQVEPVVLLEAYESLHEMLCDPSARQRLCDDAAAPAAQALLAEAHRHGGTVRRELLRVFDALAAATGSAVAGYALF